MQYSRPPCWQIASLSAWLALLTGAGCALPLGSSSHDQLLQVLTRHDAEKPLSPDSDEAPSPYPTALQPGDPTPLPLQRASEPVAMPLDRQKLVGRLPAIGAPPASEKPAAAATAPAAVQADVPENPVTEQKPIALDVSSADSVIGAMLNSAEKSWPAPAALAATSLNVRPSTAQPVNLKPDLPPNEQSPPQFIVPPAQEPPATKPTEKQPTAEEVSAETADELLPKLITALEKEIRARNDRQEMDELPALEQKLRLLKLVADESDDAVEQIEQLPAAEREAFKQMMFALTTWLSPEDARRSSLRNAKILRSLQEVNDRLSAVSKLDLKNLTFCEKVESFGWYTEFPRAEFLPKQQVILYVEVQNFAAEEKTATAFETELQGSYQIYDSAGSIIDERQLPLDREVCRNYRRDYFLAYRIYLPAEITAGRYRLELTVEDLKAKKDFKGRKQGEAMIEFTIK